MYFLHEHTDQNYYNMMCYNTQPTTHSVSVTQLNEAVSPKQLHIPFL